MKNTINLLACCLLAVSCQKVPQSESSELKELFNGKDLKDWTIKIRTHDLGDNFGNTFRVEDGMMKVRYDG